MIKMKETKEMKILNSHQIMIFDMDGTLYQLDGVNNTIKKSTLMNKVVSNSVEFVLERENLSREGAIKLIEDALKDKIGISNVLSKRYGISRSSYFDVTWNIDPKIVIKNFEIPVRTIQRLGVNNRRLFLLTAAPRVWMENVVRELKLEKHFERKIHGEMFREKNEIFAALAKEFQPDTILSVGDQFKTDLRPAMELGMSIFEVNVPEDLQKLI